MSPECRKDSRDSFASEAALFSCNDCAEQPAAIGDEKPKAGVGDQEIEVISIS